MALEFLFASQEKVDLKNLHQGDILNRNSGLINVLEQAHNYYATAPDYTHFMVLTQSCDLVLRRGKPKAKYITLAAIRPLELVTEELITKYAYDILDFPIPVCDKNQEILVRQILERLLHNTQDGMFLLKKDSHPMINKDLCVFLPLSIAIRKDHYQACIEAKVAQLDQIFQAKVGWLVGNLYSRIGTPDLEEHESDPEKIKNEFLDEVLYARTAWLSPPQLKELKKNIKAWLRTNPGNNPDLNIAAQLLTDVPEVIELLSDRVVQKLSENSFLSNDDETKQKAKNILQNDNYLKQIIRNA